MAANPPAMHGAITHFRRHQKTVLNEAKTEPTDANTKATPLSHPHLTLPAPPAAIPTPMSAPTTDNVRRLRVESRYAVLTDTMRGADGHAETSSHGQPQRRGTDRADHGQKEHGRVLLEYIDVD